MRLLGGDPWRDAATLHRRLAYVPGDVNLWPNLTGGEVIDLLGRLRGGLDARRRDELIERFELDPTKKGRSYSKGNRQKVALVAALAADVELLILDEPTSGLDPLMEAVFQDCVDEFRDAGRTVLLSSHILAEVERLCDRVSIIRCGRGVETGTLAELRHLTRTSISAELAASGTPASPTWPACTTWWPRATGCGSRSTRLGSTRRSACCTEAGVAQPHRDPADAGGALPAPLRRPDRGADRRDRGRRPAADLPAPGPLAARCGGASAMHVLYWSQAISVEGLYATQAEFDRAAARHGVQRRP